MIAIIGPNGCGKSTLLRTLAGLQKPLLGDIYVDNEKINKKSIQEKSKLISLVLTDPVRVGGLSVFDMVSMGRFPYTNWLGNLTAIDKEKIEEAICLMKLEEFRNRSLSELSDGERQRVMIAKALVQDTPIILLDEPTAHLDLNNRIEIITLLRSISTNTSKSIILSTHELDLALKLTNKIWLMDNNLGLFDKTPDEIINESLLDKAFQSNLFKFDTEGRVVFCY